MREQGVLTDLPDYGDKDSDVNESNPHCHICVALAFISLCVGVTSSYMSSFQGDCKRRLQIEFEDYLHLKVDN